jgi:hypothetical protein
MKFCQNILVIADKICILTVWQFFITTAQTLGPIDKLLKHG